MSNLIPQIQQVNARYHQMKREMMERLSSGHSVNVTIDDSQLLNAAAVSPYTPNEWADHDAQRKQQIVDGADRYWARAGQEAKNRWLSEPKRADEPKEDQEEKGQPVSLVKDEEKEEPVKMPFLEAMRPHAITSAYKNIMVDLRRWDDLPQATNLEKIQSCFLSPERIGAIVCSCLLMIVLITLIVILTM